MKYNQCRFCNEDVQKVQMEHLFNKYFNAFNFYFAKPISEILANIPTDHVILFKDLLFYNDDYEYLTKYYDQSQFLQVKTNKIPMPNMVIVTAHKIMEKRITKINKMHEKQQQAVIPVSKDRQMIPDRIFHDSFEQSNQSSFQQQSISWETEQHNIYQNDSYPSIQKTIIFTLPKPLIIDKSYEKLYNCPNDKELDQMFTQINQFTSNLLRRNEKKVPIVKKQDNKKKINQDLKKPVNIPKLKIPQSQETNKQNNFNFQVLLSQYDKILEKRKCGAITDRNYMKPKIEIKIQQIMEESRKRPKESPRVYFNQGGFPNAVTKKTSQLPSPSSTYGKNNRVSTCSPSMLLKSISKESIEKSLVNARRKEIIMNLNKLIREQERDLGYLTHR